MKDIQEINGVLLRLIKERIEKLNAENTTYINLVLLATALGIESREVLSHIDKELENENF